MSMEGHDVPPAIFLKAAEISAQVIPGLLGRGIPDAVVAKSISEAVVTFLENQTYYTVEEAAKMLKIHPQTIYEIVRNSRPDHRLHTAIRLTPDDVRTIAATGRLTARRGRPYSTHNTGDTGERSI